MSAGIEQAAFVSEENGLKGKENEKPPTGRKRAISKGREPSRKARRRTPLASKNKQVEEGEEEEKEKEEEEEEEKKKKKKNQNKKKKKKDLLPGKEVVTRATRRSTRKRT